MDSSDKAQNTTVRTVSSTSAGETGRDSPPGSTTTVIVSPRSAPTPRDGTAEPGTVRQHGWRLHPAHRQYRNHEAEEAEHSGGPRQSRRHMQHQHVQDRSGPAPRTDNRSPPGTRSAPVAIPDVALTSFLMAFVDQPVEDAVEQLVPDEIEVLLRRVLLGARGELDWSRCAIDSVGSGTRTRSRRWPGETHQKPARVEAAHTDFSGQGTRRRRRRW